MELDPHSLILSLPRNYVAQGVKMLWDAERLHDDHEGVHTVADGVAVIQPPILITFPEEA